MLRRIVINNYALIEQLEIELDPGLNVITGETGAGKSIIIDAISLLLGQRGNKDNIRTGADKIFVQGLYETENDPILFELLSENGIKTEDGQLLISRSIDRAGKNTCRINGILVTVGLLRSLGDHLIDIHSQHEHNSLFTAASHRKLLDSYGGEAIERILTQTQQKAAELKILRTRILEADQDSREMAGQKDQMQRAVTEIQSAQIKPGEDIQLEQQIQVLSHAALMQENAEAAYQLLNGSEESNDGMLAMNALLLDKIKSLAKIDEGFKHQIIRCEAMMAEMKDLTEELYDYLDKIDVSPGALDAAQERLVLLTDLKRRYGDTLEAVYTYGENCAAKLNQFEDGEGYKNKLKKEYLSVWDDYKEVAQTLHDLRKTVSEDLSQAILSELKDLAMEKAVMAVDIEQDEKRISPNGQDHVEFLIAVNPGTAPKSICKVASGGEISRIMLALKSIFAASDPGVTMIFDEIDTGISGRTAQKVAEKIQKISASHQLICITHLPQIAAMADRHFRVEKDMGADSTQVHFTTLDEADRADELARMLSGAEVTKISKENANEMLAMARDRKNR